PRAMAPTEPIPRYDLYERPWYRKISPGASSVPARSEPTMTADAPAASALAMSPLVRTPPSAITGTPFAARAASMIAVSCGTPTPATIRVVQIDPGPIPTLIASAPASTSALAASAVATLPATTWTELETPFTRSTAAATSRLWRWAVSMTMQSQPASISASDLAKPASPTVVAAATRSRPSTSFVASGAATDFSMSLTLISPTR